MTTRKLEVVYILPSRYDDDGYVMRYWRGILPSNSLNCLKSLTTDLAESGELGCDVELSVEIYDDTVQRIPVDKIVRRNRDPHTQVVVGFVAVQTNQMARATDLALEFRAAGVPVLIGGFHVSGALEMFDEPTRELQFLLDHGVTLVKGEAESPGVLAGILRDAVNGALQPIYAIAELPDLSAVRVPPPDREYLRHFRAKNMGTIDTSRGCPFDCSFCTIVNVQGRLMRHRSAAGILETIEANYHRGIDIYFFTDDNLSRSPVWEELFDGLAALRERGIDVSFLMQVDTQAYRIRNFVEKATRAGCFMVFAGMETVNPKNVAAIGKRQNKAGEYVDMVRVWRDANILVHVGYIIGLPHDTPESVRHDIEVLRDEIKVDEVSFFMLTPLPGSRDHKNMVEAGTPLDADPNNFDSTHETFRHPNFGPGEWSRAYQEAWEAFYNKENIVNILLRTPRDRYWQMLWTCIWYRFSTIAHSHPMFTGLVRVKDRRARRALFPREGRVKYAWRRAIEIGRVAAMSASLFIEFQEIWLLTRKRDDVRWKTLADLRGKWVDAERRIYECDAKNRCDDAVKEVRAMLSTASTRLLELSVLPKAASRRVRRRLRKQADDIDRYLRAFDVAAPTWRDIAGAEKYINDTLVAGYENLVICNVARRRKFNAYRRDFIARLRSGRILTLNVSIVPRLVAFELVLAIRFGYQIFSRI